MDLEIKELVKKAIEWRRAGFVVHFKFTCPKCGKRVTLSTPNTIYEMVECCVCGHVFKPKRGGLLSMNALVVSIKGEETV